MVGWLVAALLMAFDSNAIAPATFTHVRSDEAWIREVMADGYARSSTFRALVDATDAMPCVVYVAGVVRLSQGMEGALLHRLDGSSVMPVLRVHLKLSLSRDRAIAVLAHELQHVAEVIGGAPAAPAVTMSAVFNRLDSNHATGASKYETVAAQLVTDDVLNELRRRP